MDREILRVLYNQGNYNKTASGAIIARAVNLSPPAITSRLRNLQAHGIVKPIKCGNMRNFERTFGKQARKISIPSKICWVLDLKPKRKR